MGLSIKNEETERLVRELARRKGVGVTTAIRLAVSNELAATPPPKKKDPEAIMAAIREIQERVKKLPVLDNRSDDEILGYDEFGLPN
jgi:antitoxin VapB